MPEQSVCPNSQCVKPGSAGALPQVVVLDWVHVHNHFIQLLAEFSTPSVSVWPGVDGAVGEGEGEGAAGAEAETGKAV